MVLNIQPENVLQAASISLVLPCLQAIAAWIKGVNQGLSPSASRASTITLGMSQ